jgi:hypothetical protein
MRLQPCGRVLDVGQSDLDLETLDMLAELAGALTAQSIELRLASVRKGPADLL